MNIADVLLKISGQIWIIYLTNGSELTGSLFGKNKIITQPISYTNIHAGLKIYLKNKSQKHQKKKTITYSSGVEAFSMTQDQKQLNRRPTNINMISKLKSSIQ